MTTYTNRLSRQQRRTIDEAIMDHRTGASDAEDVLRAIAAVVPAADDEAVARIFTFRAEKLSL